MPEVTLNLKLDLSVTQELWSAAEYAVESGAMTVDEAAETLMSFVRVIVEEA